MILVIVLRRIGLRSGARRWPLALGWVVRDRPRSLVYITKEMVPFCKAMASVRTIDEEVARRSLSLDVEYHVTNCLTYVSRCKSGLTPFWVRLHVHKEATRFQVPSRPSLDQAKCQNKGRICFSFMSFPPCVFLSPCVEVPRL